MAFRNEAFSVSRPEMSAREAQLGWAYEFEFEFDLKFDDRVRVSGFQLPGSSFEYPFGHPFSVAFRVHFRPHFRSLSGSQKGPEKEHSQQRGKNLRVYGPSSRKCRVGPTRSIAQSPSHSLSHPSDGFATTPARTAAARASVKRHPSDGFAATPARSQCELP